MRHITISSSEEDERRKYASSVLIQRSTVSPRDKMKLCSKPTRLVDWIRVFASAKPNEISCVRRRRESIRRPESGGAEAEAEAEATELLRDADC